MEPPSLNSVLARIKLLADVDVSQTHSKDRLICNTMEELGEYVAAYAIEAGHKKKPMKESSKEEGVDLVICALALYFSSGGTINHLVEYGDEKLNKWENRLGERHVGSTENTIDASNQVE